MSWDKTLLESLFQGVYQNRRVLITGHTGFKGSWLVQWLTMMGAVVFGFSDEIPTQPNHYQILGSPGATLWGDIRDEKEVSEAVQTVSPDIVFHFAAQPLVRDSYLDPVQTYTANVMGTVHVLEACRQCPSVRAVVVATTDKVYHNQERHYGYIETDALGGKDPYSSSKAAADLVTASYRHLLGPKVLVATVRAGNVIGGGDWAKDRLLPDLYRGIVAGQAVPIRYPQAQRPWQHVLDCLSGYLIIGQHLLQGQDTVATSWNVGPAQSYSVAHMLQVSQSLWPQIQFFEEPTSVAEAGLLMLDTAKIQRELGWRSLWSTEDALAHTWQWYQTYYDQNKSLTHTQIEAYVQLARSSGLVWAE